MKRLLVIAGLVVLTAALVFLNQGMKKTAVPDDDEDQKSQQSSAQKPPVSSAPNNVYAALPSEETIGDPATARHHLEVGWVYDENNQKKPETLTVPLQSLRDYIGHVGSSISAEFVNLDTPMEDRSPAARAVTELGIRLDQKPLSTGNISSAPLDQRRIMMALGKAARP